MPSRITVRPHWIMRLLGACDAAFSFVPEGVLLEKKYGGAFFVSSLSMAEGYGVEHGVFFSSLQLHTDRGGRRLSGLKYGDAEDAFGRLRRHWYESLSEEIGEEAASLRKELQRSYLRTSRWASIRSRAAQAVELFHRVPEEGLIGEERRADFALLARVAAMGEEDAELFRARYVSRCKEAYAELFDRIESNPLTENQRDACIVDEDNNLVLAGAGTGKTSTMVGRAAFLLESGQAKPGEILMLAYGSKAAAEMRERLAERLGVEITATTFHSLGRRILADVEGRPPALSRLAEDGVALSSRVDGWFRQLLEEPDYRRLVLRYFERYLYPERNPFELSTEGEYIEYLQANKVRTLKGEAVRSLEECLIADYLFRMGVEYDYRADYGRGVRGPDYRQYRPDFHLPDSGVYIEHLEFDRDGDAPPWLDGEAYRRGVEWRRLLHEKNGTRLVETFGYEQVEGNLLELLERKLKEAGVRFDPLPEEAVLETLEESGALDRFSRLLSELLSVYKAARFGPEQLRDRFRTAGNGGQVRAALEVLSPILSLYQAELEEKGEVDFHYMIGGALDLVSSGRFRSPWRYILVDEFQDISEPRARLVKALRDGAPGASLFCVGDDWQAIYRFAGSDISFTTGFAGYFGATATTALDKTFRFNDSICDIASRFVMKNCLQVEKQLTTHVTVSAPAVSLLWREEGSLMRVLDRVAGQADGGASLFLLARFAFKLPDAEELRTIRASCPSLDIEAMTMHASKGKEADYVVVLGLESGEHGFPPQKTAHPLLEALLPKAEPFEHAEERRLFYVALTRARRRVYLLAERAAPSAFVEELIEEGYPIDKEESEDYGAAASVGTVPCPRCGTGTLVGREGGHGSFYGCSHYPLCDHSEKGCSVCGLPMRGEGRFKVCSDPGCRGRAPLCPECGGEMLRRSGAYGEFWGCKNYRSGEEFSCSYTERGVEYVA